MTPTGPLPSLGETTAGSHHPKPKSSPTQNFGSRSLKFFYNLISNHCDLPHRPPNLSSSVSRQRRIVLSGSFDENLKLVKELKEISQNAQVKTRQGRPHDPGQQEDPGGQGQALPEYPRCRPRLSALLCLRCRQHAQQLLEGSEERIVGLPVGSCHNAKARRLQISY